MGFWRTLLLPSLVVTRAQVTVGLPHLTRLEDRNRNTFKIKTPFRDIIILTGMGQRYLPVWVHQVALCNLMDEKTNSTLALFMTACWKWMSLM